MKKQIYKNNQTIFYNDEGIKNDYVIVLIHGFLETSETWLEFSMELSKNNRVISVNLAGHGKSSLHESPYTMCKYAESILSILEFETIQKVFIIGHSMGGYVALAFSDNYPEKLSGLCLFHSSPFADSDNKKVSRSETIQRIENGDLDQICSDHSKAVYATDNIDIFKNEIKKGERIAKQISTEGVIASILTMQKRDDRSHILKRLKVPFLYIIGKKDNIISYDIINNIEMPDEFEIVVLEKSGHMGMIEEKEKSLKYINDFKDKYL